MMEGTDSGNHEISWDWETTDKRIKKKILCKGWRRGSRPTEGSVCVIKIDTTNYNDVRNSSEIRLQSMDHLKLIVGEGETEFLRMIDRLLPTMDVLEECLVKYVENNLIHKGKIKLIQFGQGIPSYTLNPKEKYEKAIHCKGRGVALFKEGHVLAAYYRFRRAAQLLIFLDRDLDSYLPLYLTVCNNLAQCHLQFHNYEHVLSLCEKVLVKEPNNVKCLLRRAAALEKLRDFEKAVVEYNKIIQIESNNPTALERLPFVKMEIDDMNKRYSQAVKRMFNFE